MARDPAWSAEFHRRMREYDEARGIARPDAAPLRPEDPPLPGDSYAVVQAARRQWETDPKLRAEFTCLEAYMAFRRAEAKGLVRIISRSRDA